MSACSLCHHKVCCERSYHYCLLMSMRVCVCGAADSVRSTGWWSYKLCHGRSVSQFHVPPAGPPESLTHLGNIVLEDGTDGQGKAAIKSPGIFVAQYSKKRRREETGRSAGGHGSRLHSAEIVYSFTGGDQCEGSSNGERSGAHSSVSTVWHNTTSLH